MAHFSIEGINQRRLPFSDDMPRALEADPEGYMMRRQGVSPLLGGKR